MRKFIQTLTVLSTCFVSHFALAEAVDQLQQEIYQCERDVMLPVTYINSSSGGAYAVLQVDGQQIAMRNTVSASGALYISNDKERGYSWHSKGGSGVLSWQPLGKPDQRVIVLGECATGEEMLAKIAHDL